MDEVDVTNLIDVSAGKRAVAVGNARPFHVEGKSRKHLTAIPIVNFRHGLICNVFIQAGTPTKDPDCPEHNKALDLPEATALIYNGKGSAEGDDEDGGFGSWHFAMAHFISILNKKYGPKEKRGTKYLMLDGCQVHKDHPTLEMLEKEDIVVVVLAPNLTHLVQMSDNPRLNGKLQEKIRNTLSELCQMYGYQDPPFEVRLREIDRLITATFSIKAVLAAAADIGYIFRDQCRYVGLTDESISGMLDRRASEGKLRAEHAQQDEDDLRGALYLLTRKMTSAGALPVGTTNLVSERVIKATEASVRGMLPASLDVMGSQAARTRRVSAKDDCERGRTGTYVANSAASLEVSSEKYQIKLARGKVKGTRASKKEAKEATTKADQTERARRWEALEALFDTPIESFKNNVARYLKGARPANDISWAKKVVEIAMKKAHKADPVHSGAQ